MQEWQEASAEAGAVEVEKEAAAPMGLEVGAGREAELGDLVGTVVVPAARDVVDDGDVKVQVEGRGRQERVGIDIQAGGVREEDWEGVCCVIG